MNRYKPPYPDGWESFPSQATIITREWLDHHDAVHRDLEPRPGVYLAAFNGDGNEDANDYTEISYQIGFAVSDDGGRSFRPLRNRALNRNGADTWEAGYVHSPSICLVGRRLFLAYMGNNIGSTAPKIGLAIWNNGVPVGAPDYRELLIDPDDGEAWEDSAAVFPHLYYDQVSRLLHIFYSAGTTDIQAVNIGHATIDPDTLAVTKDAANPIIEFDAGEGEGGLQMGCIAQEGSDWHLFVGAFNADPYTRQRPTRYTAPSIDGPWTRQGVVYEPRATSRQALAANAALGATSVQVASSAVFEVGDIVYVQDNLTGVNPGVTGADNWETNVIKALPDATHVTLRDATLAAYTTARSAEIVVVDQVKLNPRSALREDGEWVFPTTAFFAGNQTYHENTVALKTVRLDADAYELDRDRGILIRTTGSVGATRNAWWKTKAENMHAIPLEGAARIFDQAFRAPELRAQKKAASLTFTVAAGAWAGIFSPGNPDEGLDAFLPALPGDVIAITPAFLLSNDAVTAYFDILVYKKPAGVHANVRWLSGGSGVAGVDQGIIGWRCTTGVFVNVGPTVKLTVLDTDLEGGMIMLRPMMRTSGGNRTFAGAGLVGDITFTYENMGGGQL